MIKVCDQNGSLRIEKIKSIFKTNQLVYSPQKTNPDNKYFISLT